MPDYCQRVPAPSSDSINTHCAEVKPSTMSRVLGELGSPLSAECQNDKASDKVKQLLETRNIGPFRVTGIKPFLDVLQRVFERVKRDEPALYEALGTVGVLCVRRVRKRKSPSNHSWGTAIDISILNPVTGKHELDLPLGNGKVQSGCLELYKHFKADAMETGDWVFWGAGFKREDGMHFEASHELIVKWQSEGKV